MKNIDKIKEMNSHDLANFISNRCNICPYRYKDCGNEMCSIAMEEYLNQECELTVDDIYREHDRFYYVSSCTTCEYPDDTCHYNFLVDHFNIIDGKITRR